MKMTPNEIARLCKCGHHEISHREGGAKCTAPNCFCPQLQTTDPVPATATASELTERLDRDQVAAIEGFQYEPETPIVTPGFMAKAAAVVAKQKQRSKI